MSKRIREGTWFAVPLRSGGYAVGVVARSSLTKGILLVYIFPGQRPDLPSIADVKALSPRESLRVVMVGDLGFRDGRWSVIGHDPEWSRVDWPVPAFVRKDDLTGRAWKVEYSDDDPSVVKSEVPVDSELSLESDALFGAGALELLLTRILAADGPLPGLERGGAGRP